MKKMTLTLALLTACLAVEAADEISINKLFNGRNCEGCDLSNENFKGYSFLNRKLSNANLRGANLEGAELPQTYRAGRRGVRTKAVAD